MGIMASLYSGISGLNANGNAMTVIGNNLANNNTVGFKAGRTLFSDLLSASVAGSGRTNQVGRGVGLSVVDNQFSQGTFENTETNSDLAIEGDGFFIVQKPAGSDLYTRAGMFRFDAEGYLATPEGFQVKGYDLQAGGGAPVPIQIQDMSAKVTIDNEGFVTAALPGGVSQRLFQIALAKFNNPGGLVKQGANAFAAGPASGNPVYGTSGSGVGQIFTYALEQSNVDLGAEFVKMITTQRGFQASTKIITSTDELLSELINLKR